MIIGISTYVLSVTTMCLALYNHNAIVKIVLFYASMVVFVELPTYNTKNRTLQP